MKTLPAILVLVIAAAAPAGVIRLKSSASVEPGAAVRLGDIAMLEGADAEGARELVIVDDPARRAGGHAWATVTIADVRRALHASGARMGALALSGGECAVRFGAAVDPKKSSAEERVPEPKAETVDLAGVPTVRKQAAAAIASHVGAQADRLRLLFDADDAVFLDAPRHGLNVVVQPQTTSASGRAVLACRVLDGDRMLENRTIRADVEVLRRAVVVQENIRRKDEIAESALSEQEMWLPLSAGRPIESIDEVRGALARTRLEAGAVLLAEHLETPVIVRRNELVSIHAVRGGFEIQMRARARADARRGEVIAFRGERSEHEFSARVERPGVAVMVLDEAGAEGADE